MKGKSLTRDPLQLQAIVPSPVLGASAGSSFGSR
jgi:hypothetical protein